LTVQPPPNAVAVINGSLVRGSACLLHRILDAAVVGIVDGRRRFRLGVKKRCATAVGTIAVSTTTETSTENCVRVMMPAFNPWVAEIVPKVSPVLISRVR